MKKVFTMADVRKAARKPKKEIVTCEQLRIDAEERLSNFNAQLSFIKATKSNARVRRWEDKIAGEKFLIKLLDDWLL